MRIEKGRLRLPAYTEHLAALEGWVVGGSFLLGSAGADNCSSVAEQLFIQIQEG